MASVFGTNIKAKVFTYCEYEQRNLTENMKQLHFLQEYLDSDSHKSFKDRFLYVALAFRPLAPLVICILMVVVVSIPCVVLMLKMPNSSAFYNVAFALLTGIIASGFVSLLIEMLNNYRHNYQRLLVLHEYLLSVAKYEDYVQWCFHGRKDDDCPGKLTARNMAVSELVLEVGPVVEAAYNNGKEFMSLKEIKYAITVIEAASKIGEIAESFASENMIDAAGRRLYEHLTEPLKSKIMEFAENVNISLIDEDLTSVVADYILTNPEELSEHEQYELKTNLEQFDEGMKRLLHLLKYEPVYNEELIPLEKRMEKSSKKINERFEKTDNKLRDKLYHAVEEKKLTETEYDEFLRLNEEIHKVEEIDMDSFYERYGMDDDTIDDELKRRAKQNAAERYKKLERIRQIVLKAEGKSLE